jgi:hypothetical protein
MEYEKMEKYGKIWKIFFSLNFDYISYHPPNAFNA